MRSGGGGGGGGGGSGGRSLCGRAPPVGFEVAALRQDRCDLRGGDAGSGSGAIRGEVGGDDAESVRIPGRGCVRGAE
eukprot:scaffold690_cov124-Isochrysis_galbana.AAC.3